MTIEEAFAAIPNTTCTVRTGGLAPPGGHAVDCGRCAAIRTFGETVLEEAERTGGYDSLAPAGVTLRARIAALGSQT